MIRVLVEARRARARAALEALVRSRRGFELVDAPVAGSLVERVQEVAPDVLLVDCAGRAEHEDRGDDVARALRGLDRLPRPPAIVLLAAARPRVPGAAALRSGVRAVLRADAPGAQILAAVEAAAAGLVTVPPEALPALRPPAHVRAEAAPGLPPGAVDVARGRGEPPQRLTARETEILAMMAEGLGNKLIAARLGISRHTAKFHVASILDKLGAESRTEAVTIGLRRGLILI